MSSMGMDKSGNQGLNSNTWTTVTSFVVRDGYPSTVITDSALVMNQGGPCTVRFQISFTNANANQLGRVVKNGVTLFEGPANVIASIADTAVVGDVYGLQAFTNGLISVRSVAGGTSTFLEVNQPTTLDASLPIGWGTVVGLGVGTTVTADRSISWSRSASLTKEMQGGASRSITWPTTADLYLAQKYNIAAERPITWGTSASMESIRPAESLLPPYDEIAVSVHTVDGRKLGDFLCDDIESVMWRREMSEGSQCELTIFSESAAELLEDLRPWVHWMTVWHSGRPMWRGPIQSATLGRSFAKIVLRDPSTFMWRTRVPLTKTWVDSDPTVIADEMLLSMFELHRISDVPIVIPGVTESFTYRAEADSRMVNQTFDDLLKLGLQWTVVAGVFILGKFDQTPFVELADCDFLVDIERLRDGTGTFNDVRVQGKNFAQTAVAPLGGLHLQTLVSLDDVFGVSNIQRATQLYVNETAGIRDVLQVPSGASLHPDAPIHLADMIPGRVLRVTSGLISSLMMIDQVVFSASSTAQDTQVTLVAVQENTELAQLVPGGDRT